MTSTHHRITFSTSGSDSEGLSLLASETRRNSSATLHWRIELKSSTRAHAPIIHGHTSASYEA